MDILFKNISDNYNKVRDRTSFSNPQSSRTSLISSFKFLVIYYMRMENNNDLEDNIKIEPINSSQLSYVTPKEQVNQVSMMADSINSMMDQYVLIKGLALNSTITSSPFMLMRITSLIFNYHTTPTGLWNLICGMVIFTVSLYRLLEHLISNAVSIRKSIAYIATYIKNKKIEMSKSNDIKNFKDIGKVAWKLILFIYESRWNSLVANNHKNTFRQKVTYKFTPWVHLEKSNKKQDTYTNKPTSIERLSPLIPVKFPKEVNEISKYFKTNKLSRTAPNVMNQDSKCLSQETTLVLEWYKRTR